MVRTNTASLPDGFLCLVASDRKILYCKTRVEIRTKGLINCGFCVMQRSLNGPQR